MIAETIAQGEQVCRAFAAVLQRMLFSRHRSRDPHLVSEAVHDTLISYLKNPAAFDENRGIPLIAFLFGMAKHKLAAKFRAEARRRRHEEIHPLNFSEDFCPDSLADGEYLYEGQKAGEVNAEPALDAALDAALIKALERPKEFKILKLWLTEEETEMYE
jgi:DNA-directed RNA polymerase specialized sigma24 family protein